MKLARAEFLKFIRKLNNTYVNSVKYAIGDIKDVVKLRENLTKYVHEAFYEDLKQEGNLKPHKEDYEGLIMGTFNTKLEKIEKNKDPPVRQFGKEMIENMTGFKSDN